MPEETKQEVEIKKCPFCDGFGQPDKVKRHKFGPEQYAHFIRCISCGAEGGWAKFPGNAIRNWNMRAEWERAYAAGQGAQREIDAKLAAWLIEKAYLHDQKFGEYQTFGTSDMQKWACLGCDATAQSHWPEWKLNFVHKDDCKWIEFEKLAASIRAAGKEFE